MRPRKKAGFFLKFFILVLAVYATVTLIRLQINLNSQSLRNEELTRMKAEQELKNAALTSFSESEFSNETVAKIAREELGLVQPDEILIVDVGH